MATRKRTPKKKVVRRTGRTKPSAEKLTLEPEGGTNEAEFGMEPTGGMLVTFLDESRRSVRSTLATMRSTAGIAHVCHASDFGVNAFDTEQAESADAVVFDEIGIAVIQGEPDRMTAIAGVEAGGHANVIIEPEYMNYAMQANMDEGLDDDLDDDQGDITEGEVEALNVTSDYLRGYAAGVQELSTSLVGTPAADVDRSDDVDALSHFRGTRRATWGLRATRVARSRASGRGIRVAVLDTGFDLRHPDFVGRSIIGLSFIRGQSVQDGNGHGTHCIGTSCGPRRPGIGPRYGIAHEAQILAGKVLSNAGSGSDSSILAGINWAVRNRCQVVSMSLGRRTRVGERPMRSYETAGRRALRAGTLIIAAAGNDSSRPSSVWPVSSPANAASIAAVAAIDSRMRVARFSNAGINPGGGEINLAGPGVNVHSSWPMPIRLRTISGTSMATPHVAGIAALLAERNSSARGVALYQELRRRARRLRLSRRDVGSGLVQA